MTWMLLDETGNAIAAYNDDVSAHAAMRSLAEAEPEAADLIVLVRYDDEGHPIGEAVTVEDLPLSTVNMIDVSVNLQVFLTRTTTGFGGIGQSVLVAARPVHVSTTPSAPALPAG